MACNLGLAKVVVAHLDAGANADFVVAKPPRNESPGFTPLMCAVAANHAGVVKLLLKQGADGTKITIWSPTILRNDTPGSTAIDLARMYANNDPGYAETLAVIRRRCCSTCGMTSPGLSAITAGEEQHLRRCGNCPARGPRARYCSKDCQRANWMSRHRGECAEARRARQAAGTEI